MADPIERAGFQVLVSFGDAETTNRVIAAIQADGTCWCGGTIWRGQTAMRISVSSWATTDEDVERSLAAMLRIAARYSNLWTTVRGCVEEQPAPLAGRPAAPGVAAN